MSEHTENSTSSDSKTVLTSSSSNNSNNNPHSDTDTNSKPPEFSEFSPYLSSNPNDILSLLSSLYSICLTSPSPSLSNKAINLLKEHTQNVKNIIKKESQLLGVWILRNRNLHNSEAAVDSIGKLELQVIQKDYIVGTITIGLDSHQIVGRYRTSLSSKIDQGGHLNMILQTRIIHKQPNDDNNNNNTVTTQYSPPVVQYHQQPTNPDFLKRQVSAGNSNQHKLELQFHTSGTAIRGEFCTLSEAESAMGGFGGEDIDSSSIYFVGSRPLS